MSKNRLMPTGTFAEQFEKEPLFIESSSTFYLSLSLGETNLGYVGLRSDDWGFVSNKQNAILFQPYPYEGKMYYRAANTAYKGKYLSYKSSFGSDRVGLYKWWGATGWTLTSNHRLVNDNNKMPLSIYSSPEGLLYAYKGSDYSVLTVTQTH